jgi:hypothetical protein
VLLPFFEWCERTFIGVAIQQSLWAFPVIEAIHLLGLALLGGAVLIVDMRLVGLGLTRQGPAELSRYIRPWLIGAVVLMLVTGTALFLSEAVKCYYNTSFWVKITTLPIAILFTFLVRERIARNERYDGTMTARLVGATSFALWFVVAAGGRWIGFS